MVRTTKQMSLKVGNITFEPFIGDKKVCYDRVRFTNSNGESFEMDGMVWDALMHRLDRSALESIVTQLSDENLREAIIVLTPLLRQEGELEAK